VRLGILAETLKVLFVIFPGDIARMRVVNHRQPLIARYRARVAPGSVRSLATPESAIDERSRITRIAESMNNPAAIEIAPNQLIVAMPPRRLVWIQ
jgi:hypothetical protein